MASRVFAHAQEAITVLDSESMEPVRWDNETMGRKSCFGEIWS